MTINHNFKCPDCGEVLSTRCRFISVPIKRPFSWRGFREWLIAKICLLPDVVIPGYNDYWMGYDYEQREQWVHTCEKCQTVIREVESPHRSEKRQ